MNKEQENQNTEWKECWRDEYLKWICGFANAQGGRLYIGKNDKGVVVGLTDAQKLLEDIPNKVRDVLGIIVDVNLHTNNGFDYIEVVVDPYPNPISYKGQYHFRSGSTKQELKGAALDRFLLKKQGLTWDGVPVPRVGVDDLSPEAIERFRTLAKKSRRLDETILNENTPQLLEKLHLFEGSYLKRSCLLLFHPDPEKFFTGAFAKIGFFRTNTDLLYHDEIHGDLFTQVSKILDILLTKYLKAGISYEGIQRVETLPVPEAALREAILNAIVHRDYSTGTPIQISVYNDKLMIWNSGELPDEWTKKNLLGKHSSKPFNPAIANAFFRAGEIEAWGRGIERIFEACRNENAHDPIITLEPNGFWIEFPFIQQKDISTQAEKTPPKTLPKTLPKTPDLILECISKNPNITLSEIAQIIEKSLSATKRASGKLVQEGKLQYVGPKKGGHWEIVQ